MKQEENVGSGLVIDPDTGEYLCWSFKGDTGTWRLIGTEIGEYVKESPGCKWYDGNVGQAMDEFLGPAGKYLKAKRKSVFAMQNDDKIKAI